jgi:hypothetical protein
MEVLLQFYYNKIFVLPDFKFDQHISRDIKFFIRSKCFVPETNVDYLKPLLYFIEENKPLHIFSTNYDNSIENNFVI